MLDKLCAKVGHELMIIRLDHNFDKCFEEMQINYRKMAKYFRGIG